jgi:uncharacterized protein (DUF488 family)
MTTAGHRHRLATIGYEAATLDEVIGKLHAAGIGIVLDIRAVAASRRAGFSKTILRNSLAEAGIGYEHLRGLGTPRAGREAARKGRIDEMRAIFMGHMQAPEVQAVLAQAIEIARAQPVALLCYEADAARCHRRIVANLIRDDLDAEVVDL